MTNKLTDGVKTMINKVKYGELQWSVDHKEKYEEFKNTEEAQVWGNVAL